MSFSTVTCPETGAVCAAVGCQERCDLQGQPPAVTLNDIVDRMEPEARASGAHVCSVGEAAQVSMAISLKRIADALAGTDTHGSLLGLIADRMAS